MGKSRKREKAKAQIVEDIVSEDKVEVEPVKAKKPKLIYIGVATTDLNLEGGKLERGGRVGILEDKGDEWLTEMGLASKLYLLLRKV